MRISDWSSDVCSSDLAERLPEADHPAAIHVAVVLDPDEHRAERHQHAQVAQRHAEPAVRHVAAERQQGAPHAGGHHQARDHAVLQDVAPHGTVPLQWKMRRSEEHTSELQSLMTISYAVFCLKKTNNTKHTYQTTQT